MSNNLTCWCNPTRATLSILITKMPLVTIITISSLKWYSANLCLYTWGSFLARQVDQTTCPIGPVSSYLEELNLHRYYWWMNPTKHIMRTRDRKTRSTLRSIKNLQSYLILVYLSRGISGDDENRMRMCQRINMWRLMWRYLFSDLAPVVSLRDRGFQVRSKSTRHNLITKWLLQKVYSVCTS